MGPPEQHGRERSRCRETQSRQQARPSEFDRSASLREWNEECKEISTVIGDECLSERQRPADDSYSTIQNGNIEKVDCECQDENSPSTEIRYERPVSVNLRTCDILDKRGIP